MSLLVTGGHGFVMSNLARLWLDRHPQERVTILDRDRPDEAARRFFAGVEDRIRWIAADILDPGAWHDEARRHGIDRIVHGAALTPFPWIDEARKEHDPEREAPGRVLDVNLGGTLGVLEFARGLPACRRLLIIGTGAVYGEAPRAGEPIAEDGPAAPRSLYAISKHAAELTARRFAELYGLPVVVARLAAVYGPMDRMLASRHIVCAPNKVTALALAGEAIRLGSAEGVGDWISVSDVAAALLMLLDAEALRHDAYNIASGRAETLARLAALTADLVPGTAWSVDPAEANVLPDAGREAGRWGGYHIGRMQEEFGWTPLPLAVRLAEYIDWRRDNELRGGPA
ncbi:NAD-dependent epimerase/dehydratase family protein [Labrys monachus]|uniref:UDP-glucose 4-epimerase n=1 Tax=Labrys monachus TaxID=217067 RepID=A0ABU0FET1_9HYPH|nr:NAD(P)-dependent oxidoreductase [Labrys monachus]MDQ0392956.1 UDP-glucose 4-epimerase [Labrys monachus]